MIDSKKRPDFQPIFSHRSDHNRFRSVSADTQITYLHIVSRQIDFSSNIRENIMIRTKGYHSPVILITEQVAVITKDSITLFGQQPAHFEDFTAIIRSRLLYTELARIGASGYDLIEYIVNIKEDFSIFVVINKS